MGLFKDVIEPAILVFLFVGCTWINRRKCNGYHPGLSRPHAGRLPLHVDEVDSGYEDSSGTSSPPPSSLSSSPSPQIEPSGPWLEKHAPNYVFELFSRFWNKYPFLPEIWYWALTYWTYQLLRAFSARMIAGHKPIFDLAREHALQILSFEHALGIDVELPIQQYVLEHYADSTPWMARVYHSHICVGVAFLVYVYTYTPYRTFLHIRRTIALDNAIAFIIITLWRCSPPRLLPPEYGFVDVLHPKNPLPGGESSWTNNRFQLTIAAMPSLHFGTALLLGVCLWRFGKHRVVRFGAMLWPVVMLVVIVATANHFLVDAAVGAVIPWVGWRFAGWMGKLKVVEDWVFGPVVRRMDVVIEDGEDEDEDGGKIMVD